MTPALEVWRGTVPDFLCTMEEDLSSVLASVAFRSYYFVLRRACISNTSTARGFEMPSQNSSSLRHIKGTKTIEIESTSVLGMDIISTVFRNSGGVYLEKSVIALCDLTIVVVLYVQ